MDKQPSKSFLVLLIGLAVVAAGFILSIPSLFGPHEPYQVWITGILGGLALTLAVLVLYLRPQRRRPPERNADQ